MGEKMRRRKDLNMSFLGGIQEEEADLRKGGEEEDLMERRRRREFCDFNTHSLQCLQSLAYPTLNSEREYLTCAKDFPPVRRDIISLVRKDFPTVRRDFPTGISVPPV